MPLQKCYVPPYVVWPRNPQMVLGAPQSAF